MRLTVEEMVEFIRFTRRADNNGQLSYIDCYGVGDTFGSADEMGEDPYYERVILSFTDDEGEEHEISFSDTTCHLAREALWNLDYLLKMVDVIGT